ncbi:MAG: hypothetical protein ACPLOT_06635, partial [Methanothrix sp.]
KEEVLITISILKPRISGSGTLIRTDPKHDMEGQPPVSDHFWELRAHQSHHSLACLHSCGFRQLASLKAFKLLWCKGAETPFRKWGDLIDRWISALLART